MFIASMVTVTSAATDWASISPLLPSHSDKLPVIPDRASAEQLFGGVNLGGGSPFAAFTIGSGSTTSLTNSRLDVADFEIPCNSSTAAALVAGPRYVCTPDDTCGASSCVCRGLSAGEPCMGVMNLCGFGPTRLQARKLRLGSARVAAVVDSANVPRRARDGASSITLRFEMDGRYRPKLYGGNPCPNASPTYNCSLCTTGAWDYRRAIAPILTTPSTPNLSHNH